MEVIGTAAGRFGADKIVVLRENEIGALYRLSSVLNELPPNYSDSFSTEPPPDYADVFQFIDGIAAAIEQSKAGQVDAAKNGNVVTIARVINVTLGAT